MNLRRAGPADRQAVSRHQHSHLRLAGIPGVEDAYVDVFIATKSRNDGGGTCEFELSAQNIASVRELGLPVRFTVAVVKP